MKRSAQYLNVLILSVFLVTVNLSSVRAQERIRAKVAIQVKSGESVTRAKAKDRIKVDDKLRIYIIPEVDSYVYVIHTDQKKVTLLNSGKDQRTLKKDLLLVLPSTDEFYQVDGNSDRELFTVICSPIELPELSTLPTEGEGIFTKWMTLEKSLIEKSKINLGEEGEKPLEIAGNVRGPLENDPFLSQLQIFSGNSLLVKRYEFNVKK
jgi:hypothetical protein